VDPLKHLWLSQKGLTYDDVQKKQRIFSCQLLDLFRLNVYQHSGSLFDWSNWNAAENEKKRLFLGRKFITNDQFDYQKALETVSWIKQFPFLRFPLESLYVHYELWKGTTATSLILTLQARLDLLHANFFALLDAVGEFSTRELKHLVAFPETHKGMADQGGIRSTLEPFVRQPSPTPAITSANGLAEDLTPYFWKDALVTGTKEDFLYILRKQTSKQFSYEQPVKNEIFNALPGMARLQLALREAKAQAASEKVLQPLPTKLEESQQPHSNKIYALRNRQNEVVAYLKHSKAFGAKTLEKLAWDLACIFQVHPLFNPTTTTTIHSQQDGFGNKSQLVGWRIGHPNQYFQDIPATSTLKSLSPFLTLAPINSPEKGIPGSFQPTIPGHELANYLVASRTVGDLKTRKDQLIHATLVTILYGMMDAHAKNIFVKSKTDEEDKEEGALIFFDNPRIFPNGDVVLAEDHLFASYRSGLLELPDTYTPLTPQEKESIKTKIAAFEAKIPFMEEHLARKAWKSSSREKEEEKKPKAKQPFSGKTLEEILPPHWFDTAKVVQNTKERLKRTREACDKATCLRDLVFAANPAFKWVAALHIAGFNSLDTEKTALEIQKISLPNVGGCAIQKVLQECQKRGIDPLALKAACENPNLSFDEILDNLFKQKTYVNQAQSQALTEEALKLFVQKAVPDFKDRDITALTLSPERLTVLSRMTLLRFRHLGIPIVELKTLRKKFSDESLDDYLFELRQSQKTLAETFFKGSSNTFVISPPPDIYTDTKFVLFYKEEKGGIQSVEIDFTSSPGNINLDNYTVPVLSMTDFKKFCDNLPISLQYRRKDETALPTETWIVQIDAHTFTPKYVSIVLLDD